MEERELRITYGMAFKVAADAALVDLADTPKEERSADEFVKDVEYLAGSLFDLAMAGQEVAVSDYAHLITEKPKRRSGGGSSGYSSGRGSGGRSSTKGGGKMTGPATEKQIALASRLLDEKPHDLDIYPDDLSGMGKQQISTLIDQLISIDA